MKNGPAKRGTAAARASTGGGRGNGRINSGEDEDIDDNLPVGPGRRRPAAPPRTVPPARSPAANLPQAPPRPVPLQPPPPPEASADDNGNEEGHQSDSSNLNADCGEGEVGFDSAAIQVSRRSGENARRLIRSTGGIRDEFKFDKLAVSLPVNIYM